MVPPTPQVAAGLAIVVGWATTIVTVLSLDVSVIAVTVVSALVPIVLLTELRAWGRLIANAIFTVVNAYVTMIPVMIFAIANLDSAVWGTRTSDAVTSEAKSAFLLRMRVHKLAIAMLYFAANFSLCFWADALGSWLDVWQLLSGVVMIVLYLFSLCEWRAQRAYLETLGLLGHHEDAWRLDRYQKAGGAACCDCRF